MKFLKQLIKWKEKTNEWNVRDIVTDLTKMDFYPDKSFDSLDEDSAKSILNQIKNSIDDLNEDEILQIYDKIYQYSR
jgi:hypothetical protein